MSRNSEAVLWRDGQIMSLGTFGGTQGTAFAVNDRGQVVGAALNEIKDPFSAAFLQHVFFTTTPFTGTTEQRAFLWQKGVLLDLGTLGGPDSGAGLINERGQVAGASYTNSTPNPVTNTPTIHPFLWEDGRMIDLGSLGGTLGYAESLNEMGQVVGESNLPGDLNFHPFLWEDGVLTDLGTLGGDTGYAAWINDRGWGLLARRICQAPHPSCTTHTSGKTAYCRISARKTGSVQLRRVCQ